MNHKVKVFNSMVFEKRREGVSELGLIIRQRFYPLNLIFEAVKGGEMLIVRERRPDSFEVLKDHVWIKLVRSRPI